MATVLYFLCTHISAQPRIPMQPVNQLQQRGTRERNECISAIDDGKEGKKAPRRRPLGNERIRVCLTYFLTVLTNRRTSKTGDKYPSKRLDKQLKPFQNRELWNDAVIKIHAHPAPTACNDLACYKSSNQLNLIRNYKILSLSSCIFPKGRTINLFK